jgi:hypothetical protein
MKEICIGSEEGGRWKKGEGREKKEVNKPKDKNVKRIA